MSTVWSDIHQNYQTKDWIHKPSLFAEYAKDYFPTTGRILELGAGLGQDSTYFAELGYTVISTDLEPNALEQTALQLTDELKQKISYQQLDLRQELAFETNSFDVVYAHLSLHYFDHETTIRVFDEIARVLKPGGVVAFLVNSIHDPEYQTGTRIEDDYFLIGKATKRYLSAASAQTYTVGFETILLDEQGETYKDRDKGVHNLVRYIGRKPNL